MSYARLVLSTSSKEEMPTFAVNVLPQRNVTTSLAEHYLENIHSLYPFLSETKLFAAIDAVYQDRGRYASPTDHWTTRMVLAIACSSMSRKRGDTHYQDAVRHVVGALENIESVVHPGSVSGIQAMLLLVLYGMLDPHHFNSWYLVGLASRAMVDIGMHQDPPKELRLKEVDQELRKHVYASIYALDRSVDLLCTLEHSLTFLAGQSAWFTAGVSLSQMTPQKSLIHCSCQDRTVHRVGRRFSCIALTLLANSIVSAKYSLPHTRGFSSLTGRLLRPPGR